MSMSALLAINGPMTNNELTAKRAEDSMSMVATVLYKPLNPVADFVAARTFLLRMMSRTTIMRVRRMLSESVTEWYARWYRSSWTNTPLGQIARIPAAIISMSALSVTAIVESSGTHPQSRGT